ncbi:MAG: metallophosphoesterase, partial [Alistipes sp.]|nr:metallophosphoesterase [Alistipes sp.]
MLFWIVIVLTLCSVAADSHHFRRLRREGASPLRRRIFVVWAATTDALPLIVALGGWLLRDNTTTYMLWSMWLFWIWIVAVASRMILFVFNALRLSWIGLAASLGIAVAMIWGATAGRTTLHVDRIEVCSPRLPAAFDGLHVVQISDLHVGTLVRPVQELRRLVDRIDELHPDLIIFTGDLVNIRSGELTPDILRELQRISAPVYSVTGNHDAGNYIKDCLLDTADAAD